jgi:hypothetical protein
VRRRALGLAVGLAAGAASAQPPAEPVPLNALHALHALGRTLAAAPCARPQETKTVGAMTSVDCRSWRVAFEARDGTLHALALVVFGAPPALPPGLAPGSLPADVRQRLGAPTLAVGRSFGYAVGRDNVMFEVGDDGRIQAVSWSWAEP